MKFCSKCGTQLVDEAEICPNCGCRVVPAQTQTNGYTNGTINQGPVYTGVPGQVAETSTLGVLAIILAIFIPIAGFICGLIGLSKYKEPNNRRNAKIGVIISVVLFIINIIVAIAYIALVLYAANDATMTGGYYYY